MKTFLLVSSSRKTLVQFDSYFELLKKYPSKGWEAFEIKNLKKNSFDFPLETLKIFKETLQEVRDNPDIIEKTIENIKLFFKINKDIHLIESFAVISLRGTVSNPFFGTINLRDYF